MTYIKSSLILLAVLALAGCAKTDELQYNADSTLEIASVSGISPFALMNAYPQTKAVIEGETLPSDEAAKGIGLFVTAKDGVAYDGHEQGYSNVAFTYSGGKWSTTTPIYLSNTEGRLYGYFPYNASATDLTAIPVESSLNGSDHLYATPGTVSHSSKSASIAMNHALARLHLTLKVNTEKYKAAGVLSNIRLKSTAIAQSGTMDITDGTVTPANPGEVSLAADGTITAEGIVKDILLVTGNNSSDSRSDLTILLTVDGTQVGVALTGENGIIIRQGRQYDLTLTLEDTGIKVGGVGVGTWGEGRAQQVQVGAYTVTVKLAEEQLPDLSNDIICSAKPRDNQVSIEAYIWSQNKRLSCFMEGDALCNTDIVRIGNSWGNWYFYKFTISNIVSDITATIGYPRPESIALIKSNLTTYSELSFPINATISPGDAYNKNLIWTSSNESVATVDTNGRVTTHSVGTADIIATTEVGGLTSSCKVTVEPAVLQGEFSVGKGKTVHFSRGNLRYTPDIKHWWFFDNQYDNGHSSNQLSLFTWGYGNWSIDWKTTSCETSNNFTDWGSQMGDGKTWRTLTKAEWEYLLNTRTDAANKVGYATVCGMHGIILLPDHFDDPNSNTSCFGGAFVPKSSTGWDQNVYTSGDSWNRMESAGAVFLPAAGYGDGDRISSLYLQGIGFTGEYWFSTPLWGVNETAYDLSFSKKDVYPGKHNNRNQACSVRLVTEYK
ncbi:MAG: fimbrillin family protein [Bacteroidales bacterium]|nr:fimbrillin family protein [Bacteroidales bacterium]